jgi:hypothetical protein
MKHLNKFIFIILLMAVGFYFFRNKKTTQQVALESAYTVTLEWNKLILDLERHTAGYRPPVSARMFAYVGICAYEVAAPMFPNPSTLLPTSYIRLAPKEPYNTAIALNAAYAKILGYFFASTPLHQLHNWRKLEKKLSQTACEDCDEANIKRSVAFGESVADAVWQYACSDTIGHDAYLYNYDKNYAPPICKSCWQPSAMHPMPALLPYWENVRTFLVPKNEVVCHPPLAFDETPNSPFYTEAMEVFLAGQNRSYDDIWIAEFWADDLPELTVTPVGRWYSIANQCFTNKNYSFQQMINTYFQLGIALNDAAVNCWAAKYHYNIQRPETYIQQHISSNWQPLHETPSFPSYPSGHATFGAVAVEILKANLGEITSFTDKTHEERPEFRGRPRTYHSFDEMAKENAFSRLPMGVHYRMDCEEGFRMGKFIGKKVVSKSL